MDSDILVVDDSAAIRKILTRVLRQTGMAIQTIHEAGDGQAAKVVRAQLAAWQPRHLVSAGPEPGTGGEVPPSRRRT